MNMIKSRTASMFAATAALAMTATPVFAQSWGGGWGRRHHDVDAGDVITGILILGGIAAVASAASNAGNANRNRNRNRDYEDRDYQQNRDYRNDDRRNQRAESTGYGRDDRPAWQEGRGIDAAVNSCVGEIERGERRVANVDQVNRDGQGWQIAGQTNGGDPFACAVGSNGRIRSATVNGTAA
jgi:hypothetical protein